MGAGLAVGAYNALAWWLHRRTRRGHGGPTGGQLAYAATLLDYLVLTLIVWRLGGTRSPLMGFYLRHAVLGAILLERREALTNMLVAFVLLAGLVLAESGGVLAVQPVPGMLGSSLPSPPSWSEAAVVLVIYAMLLALTSYLVIGVSESLRHKRRALESANRQLEHLLRLRRDFMRLVLHNLRSPVGVVSMHLRNMIDGRGGGLPEPDRGWTVRSLERLTSMTQFLSDFQMLSLLDTGELQQQRGSISMRKVLEEVVTDYRDQAQARGHTFRLELPAEEALTVSGIHRLLQEAVANYVTNAVKYTPRGGTIIVRGRTEAGQIVVEVLDNGIGVPPDQQQKLFQEGVRLETEAGGERREGTGLGLWLVKRIVEWHGGSVDMSNRPGGGSMFILRLPAATSGEV